MAWHGIVIDDALFPDRATMTAAEQGRRRYTGGEEQWHDLKTLHVTSVVPGEETADLTCVPGRRVAGRAIERAGKSIKSLDRWYGRREDQHAAGPGRERSEFWNKEKSGAASDDNTLSEAGAGNLP